LPILDNNFPCDSDKPLITPASGVIGYSAPVESGGPSLMARAIFLFLFYQCNLKTTVYGGSTLVTKFV